MKKLFSILLAFSLSIAYANAQCVTCVNSTANGSQASVIGSNSSADGIGSISIGSNVHTLTNANNSIVIGTAVQSVGALSFVIGCGNGNYMLSNGLQQSLVIGFNSNLPTLFISRSDGYNKTGRVGIGNVIAPDAKLHIRSDDGSSATLYLQPGHWTTTANAQIWMGNKNNGISADFGTGMVYHTETNHLFEGGNVFVTNGAVGIGTNQTNGYKLAVNGKILAEEIKVTEDVPGSDYVFEKDYPLLKLTEVEKYVQKNKHLPEVKSAEEFKTQGYKIGEMDDVLLRKIEELTLYTIKQQKMIEQQAKMLETQQKQIDELIKTR